MGAGKLDFLLNDVVASTMDVQIKAGMNRVQWNMRGVPAAGAITGGGNGGRNGRNGRGANAAGAAAPAVQQPRLAAPAQHPQRLTLWPAVGLVEAAEAEAVVVAGAAVGAVFPSSLADAAVAAEVVGAASAAVEL